MGTCQVEKVVEESQVGEGEVETLCRRLKGLCHGQVGHSSVRRHIFGQAPGGLICLCGIYAFQALEQTIVAAGTRLLTLPTRQNSFTGPTQTPRSQHTLYWILSFGRGAFTLTLRALQLKHPARDFLWDLLVRFGAKVRIGRGAGWPSSTPSMPVRSGQGDRDGDGSQAPELIIAVNIATGQRGYLYKQWTLRTPWTGITSWRLAEESNFGTTDWHDLISGTASGLGTGSQECSCQAHWSKMTPRQRSAGAGTRTSASNASREQNGIDKSNPFSPGRQKAKTPWAASPKLGVVALHWLNNDDMNGS